MIRLNGRIVCRYLTGDLPLCDNGSTLVTCCILLITRMSLFGHSISSQAYPNVVATIHSSNGPELNSPGVCVCMFVYVYVCMCVCAYVCMCVYVCMCMYVRGMGYVYVCVAHVYVCVYTRSRATPLLRVLQLYPPPTLCSKTWGGGAQSHGTSQVHPQFKWRW